MSNLVIVESPSKAGTIKGYLGSNYKVVASVGHVRDLPKSTLGVDVDNGFEPHYINIRGKGDLIKELKKYAKKASKIYLATDPDREGEAISWHLAHVLDIPLEKTLRVTFNEITKPAVTAGIKAPRHIDMDIVNSQQARRILDRIVGYNLSPFLWKNVKSGLSAGRVQSVATKIVVDREEAIKSFIPEEYHTITATLSKSNGESFKAQLYGIDGDKIDIKSINRANEILNALKELPFIVSSVKNTVKKRNPLPPFTTSTLQQDASKKLNFSSARTMKIAQELYEGIAVGSENGGTHGLITYMRTDSLRVSEEAQNAAKTVILENYGAEFYPDTPRVYKTKASAQDAHEAIRPSDVALLPKNLKKHLSSDQFRLYKLIWERFTASQMSSALYDTVNAEISAGAYLFKASGSVQKFKGYLALYDDSTEGGQQNTGSLPVISEKESLTAGAVEDEQHFTEPPAHFNEASLIKFLEENGIGRPSTIAPTISLIISRGYVMRDGKTLLPTPLGNATTKLISENFDEIVDYKFTAQMETELDEIASRNTTMEQTLSKFYRRFSKSLKEASEKASENAVNLPPEETELICDKCGSRMIIKSGRFGKFAACPNYPACKNTKPLPSEEPDSAETNLTCEICGSPVVKKKGRYGEFYACSKYPECKYTYKPRRVIEVPCPLCGKELLCKTTGKSVFYSCESYPECDYSTWDRPTLHSCPDCGAMLYYKKAKKQLVCKNKECGYFTDSDEDFSSDITGIK